MFHIVLVEQAARARIAAMPDGVYDYETFLDDDTEGDTPVPIKVKVIVDGDQLTVDYRGIAEQAHGSINSGYYGGGIHGLKNEKTSIPTQMHFGEKDQGIPMSDVEIIKQKRSDCEIYVYPEAGHGFHCDERGSYHQGSSKLAWDRTTAFLAKHMK